jgi:hypothetical protein
MMGVPGVRGRVRASYPVLGRGGLVLLARLGEIASVSGMLPVQSVRDVPGLYQLTVTSPLPLFCISVDSKGS